MHDLLRDPIFGVTTPAGPKRLSLPALITALLRGEVQDYTGLRSHQADPWHVFLVQIAASVMARHPDVDSPPADEEFWRRGLLDLADGGATAWELVVDDITQPAFMQHPLKSMDDIVAFKPMKPKARTPDELDVLVTAKDHDIKMARMQDDAEAWVHAVVVTQTTSGFLGAGNYGVVRMNGGFGSRCIVSLVTDPSPCPRFAEELAVVRRMRDDALGAGLGLRNRAVVLTWATPWNRNESQYLLNELEPWFIESARPLRLVLRGSAIIALGATSKARQIGPKILDSGDVADPWLPINAEDKKKGRSALTISASGWSPESITDLLLQRGHALTRLQRPRAEMSDTTWLLGSVLVRGKGTTEGFHRFAVPVPGRVIRRLLVDDERTKLGQAAQDLLTDARAAENALVGALEVLARSAVDAKGPGHRQDDTVRRWSRTVAKRFSDTWSDKFFTMLWRTADQDEAEVRKEWAQHLVTRVRELLRDSEARLPRPGSRRYRALVGAEARLNGNLSSKGLIGERNAATRETAS